jgi:hypothetical protein
MVVFWKTECRGEYLDVGGEVSVESGNYIMMCSIICSVH